MLRQDSDTSSQSHKDCRGSAPRSAYLRFGRPLGLAELRMKELSTYAAEFTSYLRQACITEQVCVIAVDGSERGRGDSKTADSGFPVDTLHKPQAWQCIRILGIIDHNSRTYFEVVVWDIVGCGN